MSEIELDMNEYLDLPGDPEAAFAILQKKKYAELERGWRDDPRQDRLHEQRYIDALLAFDEVHSLGIFGNFGDVPASLEEFQYFFREFNRHAEMISEKIKIEAARRAMVGAESIVVLDAASRQEIHTLIRAIREKLDGLDLTESKREALFNKLHEFAKEVDKNRTRTEAFFAFFVQFTRSVRELKDEAAPALKTLDRLSDAVEKADKLAKRLPPWETRRRIEGPPKQLPAPEEDGEDEAPC